MDDSADDFILGKNDLTNPIVIYNDYNKIWAELSHMYWSTSSLFLVSRYPLSCLVEIISHYCPHCLTRYMEDEANLYKSRCHSCFQCPLCECILVLSPVTTTTETEIKSTTSVSDTGIFELVCRYCSWISHLRGDDKTDFSVAIMERERVNVGLDSYKEVNEMHQKHLLKIDSLLKNEDTSTVMNGLEVMPNRVGLQTKRVIRCKRDLELNKPNILAQHKPLPLEGDSSMKVYRGKWWVKDSSAIHFVPSLLLTRLPSAQELLNLPNLPNISPTKVSRSISYSGCRLEFTLSNPRDTAMTVSIQAVKSFDTDHIDTKEPTFTPFHCATVPLSAMGESTDAPTVTVSLAAYEDELLREVEDDEDDETVISKIFETQISDKKEISTAESTWLTASLHNTCRVSILLQPLQLDEYQSSILKPQQQGMQEESITGQNKLVCTLSLRLILNIESMSKSPGESSTVDLMIAIPIEW